MLCSSFLEGSERQLNLDNLDESTFRNILLLACGVIPSVEVDGLAELMLLGKSADFLQIEPVRTAIESEVVKHISADTCWEIMKAASECGL